MATFLKREIPLFERLLIESQSNCNRSCWFCPRTYDRSGRYLDEEARTVFQQMPTEKILELLDQAQALGFRGRVAFHHYSEPLLDKRNLMLAREAKKRGMEPDLHTNGDGLKHNEELCREIREVYTFVVLGLYDYTTNAELEQAKAYWRERLPGVNLSFSPIGLAGSHRVHSIAVPRALVPPDTRMTIPDLTYSNAPCHRPLIRMIVQHNGEICNCCEDTSGAFHLGNVYQSSIEELWFSQRHLEIIRDLVSGRREQYSLCRICPMSPTGRVPDGIPMSMASRRYPPAD